MNSRWYARAPHALVFAGMISSLGAVSAWGAAGDNGQFFMIEGLYLEKDEGDSVALTTSFGPGAFNLITSDVIEVDNAGGLRATAQFVSYGHTWQASAFAVTSFEDDCFHTNLQVPGNNTSTTYGELLVGATPENSQQIEELDLRLESDLWGAEFSWVRNAGSHGWNSVDVLVGVRYIHFGEELRSAAFDDVGTLTEIDRSVIDVDNDLVGLQIGLQGMWGIGSRVAVGGSLKGGIAANFINRDRSFIDIDAGPDLIYADTHDDTGFAQFAEFNPRIDVALSESATLTFAGTVLWINETTRAVDHYETVADVDDANLRGDEDELFYGASVGLRLALN